MKRLVFIIIFMLSISGLRTTIGGQSTLSNFNQTYTDRREVLVMELHDAFVQANFNRIECFFHSRVELVYARDTNNIKTYYLTSRQAVARLNSMAMVMPYKKFNIWTWQNRFKDGIATVQIMKDDSKDSETMLFHFVLEEDCWVKQLVIE